MILLFLVPTSVTVDSATTSGATSSGSESSFPWVIFAAIIPAIIVPIMVATRNKQEAAVQKPKKAKRKPEFIHDASGETLEIVDDEDNEISQNLA